MFINRWVQVSDFVTTKRQWNLASLNNVLSEYVIEKINSISVPITKVKDKLIPKFISGGEFTVNTATWTNNKFVYPHPKAKFSIVFDSSI